MIANNREKYVAFDCAVHWRTHTFTSTSTQPHESIHTSVSRLISGLFYTHSLNYEVEIECTDNREPRHSLRESSTLRNYSENEIKTKKKKKRRTKTKT